MMDSEDKILILGGLTIVLEYLLQNKRLSIQRRQRLIRKLEEIKEAENDVKSK